MKFNRETNTEYGGINSCFVAVAALGMVTEAYVYVIHPEWALQIGVLDAALLFLGISAGIIHLQDRQEKKKAVSEYQQALNELQVNSAEKFAALQEALRASQEADINFIGAVNQAPTHIAARVLDNSGLGEAYTEITKGVEITRKRGFLSFLEGK